MSRRQGRGRRQDRRRTQGARLSPVVVPVSAIPQELPTAEALASGRVVALTQPSARAVASYANTANALQAQQARRAPQITQPGVMTSPDKQYPAMPKIARKTPLLESMGAPGTAIFQGIITNDDYNPDFYWRDAIEIYDQMVRNDGQIMAIVQQLELPIRRATWTVEPFSDHPRDKEIASFVESCLFHDLVRTTADKRRIHQKWDDILRHALMMLRYGFAAFEKVWRKEDGWVKLAHLMPLLPMSVYRWWVGQDTELVGIQQYTFKDYTYCFVDIPADKILLFTHRMEGQNFQGFSLLRAAYKHWYYKDQFYKIDAIGLERNAIAVPYIELPQSFNNEDVTQAQAILANLRANESMGVTLPFGWKIGYIPNSEHYQGHALKSIEHHDVMIARSVLAQFINLGSGETGTYNLAVDQRQDLLESLQAEAEYIEDVFSADLIPQLVDFNFADVEGYPRIKCSKLAQADITELTEAIAKLKAREANFLTPDAELEDWIRDQFGMPKASKSVIAGANPTAPTTPGRPDAQPGQASDHEHAESAPVDGKTAPPSAGADDGDASGGDAGGAAQASARDVGVALADVAVKHSGVMVALMVPPDVAKRIAWPGGEPASDLHITLAYLGDAEDLTPRQQTTLKRVVASYVADREPLTARISGVGSFPPSPSSEGKTPIYAKVAIAGIQQWRAGLVEALKGAGLPVDETFKEYTPHITLKYATEDEPLAPPHKVNESIAGLRFTLRTVTCAIGDERTDSVIGEEQGYTASDTLSADVRLLREAVASIAGLDAVERGLSSMEAAERLASMTLFNPNHDPHSGEFSSGGGGAGGASGEGAAKGSRGGGRSRSGGKAKAEGESKPRASRAAKTVEAPKAETPRPAVERQRAHEAEAAQHEQAAKAALVKRDAAYAAGRDEASNRYHAEAQREFAAQRESMVAAQREATIARSQDVHGNQLPEAQPGATHPAQLVNVHTPEEDAYLRQEFPNLYVDNNGVQRGSMQLGVRTTDARLVAHLYGEHQTGAVLHQQSAKELRASAEMHGLDTKGSKAALVSRLTSFATGGRYSANFSTKRSPAEIHAAKAARLKATLDKAQAAYDAHMANAPKLSEQSAHALEAARLLAEVRQARAAYLLHNPNHDAKGRFASGSGSSGAKSKSSGARRTPEERANIRAARQRERGIAAAQKTMAPVEAHILSANSVMGKIDRWHVALHSVKNEHERGFLIHTLGKILEPHESAFAYDAKIGRQLKGNPVHKAVYDYVTGHGKRSETTQRFLKVWQAAQDTAPVTKASEPGILADVFLMESTLQPGDTMKGNETSGGDAS